MSLVITSNEISGTNIKAGQFQSAFSWSNHLNQPLVIKANSEVAVQSLKVNKDGTITINPSTIFYLYWGVKLADGSVSLDNTTSAIHVSDLGIDGIEEVSVEELATKITTGLNRALPTPETYGLAECEVIRNASGTDFQGFSFKFSSRTDGSALNNIPQTWNSIYQKYFGAGVGLTFNSASNTLTPIAKYVDREGKALYNMAIGEDTPLALNKGEYIVDLTNATSGAWAVGLRRCVGVKGDTYPDIFDYTISDTEYDQHYADYVVYAEQDKLGGVGQNFKIRVYQSGYDSNRAISPDEPLTLKSVDYITGAGDFNSIYNWSTNASGFTKIKFVVNNELIKVSMINPSGESVLVADSGDKDKRFNPVRDTCRNLYPMCFCAPNSTNSNYLKIDKWSGREIVNFNYSDPTNDWWAYLTQNDLERRDAIPVETRPFLNSATATTHTYKGINASGVFEDYDFVMILREDTNLYKDSSRANADTLFGFPRVVVLDNATKSGTNLEVSTYISNTAPLMKSTSSIFVRLKNLPVKSYNGGRNGRSQIIYSVPRFSTGTDQSVGALFYESPEKTYISLDNLNDINMNTIDIDIVNSDETLAQDLLGKSVCVLHFREKVKS
jgi:hypothetical protein